MRGRTLLAASLLAGLAGAPALAAEAAKDQAPAPAKYDLQSPQLLTDAASLKLHLERHSPPELVVNSALPAQKLEISRAGTVLETRESPSAEERFAIPEPPTPVYYTARLLDAKGQELASQKLLVSPLLTQFQLHVSANQVFGAKLSPLAISAGPGELALLLDGQPIHSRQLTQAGTVALPALPLPPGRHQLQAQLNGPSGPVNTPPVQIFSFGVEPLDHDWLLADKYNFTLYWIRAGALYRIYPVATGRPGLPTQPGFWLIGGKDVWFPESDWGSFRLRIYRENQYKTHWSGYAVHGTNRPDSIGTEASHGCLRMFNKDVTELYQGVQVGMPLQIEEKLPVYIEKIGQ